MKGEGNKIGLAAIRANTCSCQAVMLQLVEKKRERIEKEEGKWRVETNFSLICEVGK